MEFPGQGFKSKWSHDAAGNSSTTAGSKGRWSYQTRYYFAVNFLDSPRAQLLVRRRAFGLFVEHPGNAYGSLVTTVKFARDPVYVYTAHFLNFLEQLFKIDSYSFHCFGSPLNTFASCHPALSQVSSIHLVYSPSLCIL